MLIAGLEGDTNTAPSLCDPPYQQYGYRVVIPFGGISKSRTFPGRRPSAADNLSRPVFSIRSYFRRTSKTAVYREDLKKFSPGEREMRCLKLPTRI